jgi:VPDSG-CTERM motif
MKNLTKTLTVLAVGLFSCGLFCQQAKAITGTIEFIGGAHASGKSGPGKTTISFTNPWHVVAGDGDYLLVTPGTPATFNGFSFHGDGLGATLDNPVTPQWSFVFGGNTYTFNLLVLTSGHTESGAMAFTGTGTATFNGAPSDATWSLQGSSGGGFTFKLSSSTTGSTPDGGSAVALLGIALAGIEGARRLIRSRKP